jgi:alpha-glucosidase (family GH31 glycosyl hydrolase)
MHRYSFPHEPVANPDAVVGGTGKYRFTLLADGLLRYEWAEDSQFEDRASVLAINRCLPVPEFRVKDDEDTLQIITSRFHLTYNKQSFSPSGLSAVVKGHYGAHSSIWRYGTSSSNLGGTARTLDEIDGRIALENGVISRQGYATLDDSKSMLFNEKQWVVTRLPGDRVDGYLFAYGHNYQQAIQAFYLLSGPQPLLPRWALGNWWSRYYAYTSEDYLELMGKFEENGIPLSVAVLDMDWHIVDDARVKEAGVTGWTGYTWNKKLFPDPKAFLAALHDKGLRVALNDHPADGVQSYEDPYEEMALALNHDTSMRDPIPFDITNQAFLDAFFDVLHRKFEKEGLDLWWVDWQQGTHSRIPGIDPLWVLNHYQFLDSALDNKRPLTFSRYAGPGSHRLPIGFSGDSCMTWDSLNFQPEFTATASNIGYGWWSHDIGGHFHGERSEEMLIRWVQLGTFSPVLRLHSSNNIFSIKEPWKLAIPYRQVMTKYLQLRHRLVPYLYTMNARAAIEGIPLVRPMYWGYPDSEEAYNVPNQYMFGSELIIAPITTPSDPNSHRSEVFAWLPPGRYVDLSTGMVYDGDRRLRLNRAVKKYPIFAREGAIIPFDSSPVLRNGCENPSVLELMVVVGVDGTFELLEDDGTGQLVDQNKFRRTPISFHQESKELIIGPTSGEDQASHIREWSVQFMGYQRHEKAQVSITTSLGNESRTVELEGNGRSLAVELGSFASNVKITVRLEKDPVLDVQETAPQIVKFLRNAQMNMDLKDRIRRIVESSKPKLMQISELHTLALPSPLFNPIFEVLLADSRVFET